MENENRELQRQLQKMREGQIEDLMTDLRAMRDTQTKQGELLAVIGVNTAGITSLVKRIEKLENAESRRNGALAVAGFIWVVAVHYASLIFK